MKKRMLSLSFMSALCFSNFAVGDERIYEEEITISEVTSIYDADTFRANIKKWPGIVGDRIPIRINGVDAPEMKGKCDVEKMAARKAKQYTVAMLRGARKIVLKNVRRGKYFRLLADVYADGKNIAAELISAGLARPYDGGARLGWCRK